MYDVGPNYLVMELIEGPTLAARIEKGRFQWRRHLESSLAAEALSGSNKDFLILAEEKFKGLKEDTVGGLARLVQPLHETLSAYQRETKELQQKRDHELGSVGERLRAVAETEAALRTETAKLVTALQSHRARGRWG